jgi:hypothetical protein
MTLLPTPWEQIHACHLVLVSKLIKDLNIRPETLKLVQERAEDTLEAIGIGKDFLNRTQVA